MLFAAGKVCSALTDNGFITIGQFHDEIVTAGFFRRFDDLFHRRIRLPETDIVGNGVLEQVDALEHKAEISHKAVHAVFLYIHTA